MGKAADRLHKQFQAELEMKRKAQAYDRILPVYQELKEALKNAEACLTAEGFGHDYAIMEVISLALAHAKALEEKKCSQ